MGIGKCKVDGTIRADAFEEGKKEEKYIIARLMHREGIETETILRITELKVEVLRDCDYES